MSNNHILNEEDVINIRTRYNNKEPRWHKNHFGNSNLVKNTNINENDVYYIR